MKTVYVTFCIASCMTIFAACAQPGGGGSSPSASQPQVVVPTITPAPVASLPAAQTPAATATPMPTPTPSPTPALFSCAYQAGFIAVCTGGVLGSSLVQFQGCAGRLTDDSDYDAVSTVVNSIDPASGGGKSCITYGGDYPATCCGLQMNLSGLMSM